MIKEEINGTLLNCVSEEEKETSFFQLTDLINEYNERLKTNRIGRDGRYPLSLCNPVFKGEETVISPMTVEEINAMPTKEQEENNWMITGKVLSVVINNIPSIREGIRLKDVIKELGLTGKIYYKSYKDEIYVIFKGNPRARDFFTGTRYKNLNPKIVKFGLSKVNLLKGFKGAGITALIFYGCAKVVEGVAMYLNDGEIKPAFFSEMPADMTKLAISCFAATAAGFVITTIGAPVAVGIGVALVVGYFTDMALNYIDERTGFTKVVSDATENLVNNLKKEIDALQKSLYEKGQEKILEAISSIREEFSDILERALRRGGEALKRKLFEKVFHFNDFATLIELRPVSMKNPLEGFSYKGRSTSLVRNGGFFVYYT